MKKKYQGKHISMEHHCGYDADSKYMIFCKNEYKSPLGSNRGLYSLEQTHVLTRQFVICTCSGFYIWSSFHVRLPGCIGGHET